MDGQHPALLISLRAAAALLGISEDTLRRWAKRGDGPTPVRIGGRVLIRRIDVERLASGKQSEHSRT